MSINRATLLGHVGQDIKISQTQDGRELVTFSLATSENWKDKRTGEKKQKTEWHRIVVFSEGLVGIIKNYVKKGSKLYLEGQLQTRKWNDKQGVDHYTTEVVLNFGAKLQLLDSVNKSAESNQVSTESQETESTKSSNDDFVDDEIPF